MGKMTFDVAAAIDRGKREYQEDAVTVDFSTDTGIGYVVLADGMGGHAAGDIASEIVVTEMANNLKKKLSNGSAATVEIPSLLQEATMAANASIAEYVSKNRDVRGMGATLVAPVVRDNALYWISVGDSPLYLFDGEDLHQINEDHSMAPQIDFMAESGLLDAEIAKNHPDRNCLTSVLIGGEIERIDCPEMPFPLAHGDIIVVASDGLQFLEDADIRQILSDNADAPSNDIASALLAAIESLDDPEQDNLSLAVIKVVFAESVVDVEPPASESEEDVGDAASEEDDNIVRVPEFEIAETSPLTGAMPIFFPLRRRKAAEPDN